MSGEESRVTLHMAASLDGFVAREDGRVDWMHTSDRFEGGKAMDADFVAAFLETIDCYVMGARTYELALTFEDEGHGWSYGDKPTFVLTSRDLVVRRGSVELVRGDLAEVLANLRARFEHIWVAGGPEVCGECLRRGLCDEISYSILPVVLGSGLSFFAGVDESVALHLVEETAYDNGMVELRYEVLPPKENP